jgi:ABC-2 type transport system ATP-binding protein
MIIDRGRIIAQGTPESLRQQWLGRTMVTVTLKQGAPDAADRLRALDGVLAVNANDGAPAAANAGAVSGTASSAPPEGAPPTHFQLECAEGHDPREAVFRLAVERGWILLELKQSKASLEDIFVRLTTREQDEEAAGDGAEA